MLRVIKTDLCPKTNSTVIEQWLCGYGNCKYYDRFDMYNDLPCVNCTWGEDASQTYDDEEEYT